MKKTIMISNNKHTIVNLSNSVLKRFHVQTHHDSIDEIDRLLCNRSKIVVLLFDGLGDYIINTHLKKDGFIRSHQVMKIDATFPPTTVASTVGFLTGKYPIETGWLAWNQYFKDYGFDIEVFKNTKRSDGTLLRNKEDNILFKHCPYISIFDLIKKANPNISTFDIRIKKVDPKGPKTLREARKMINKALSDSNESFTYFYWSEPDSLIHHHGVHSLFVHFSIKRIERFIKDTVKKNPDTLFISIADHGLIDVSYFNIYEHTDLYSLFVRKPTLESRSMGFFIKEENKTQFIKLFNNYYQDYFDLLSHDEIISSGLYGEGKVLKQAEEFIPDFVAIAKTNKSFYIKHPIDNDKYHLLKGHHAGGTNEEREISVSVYNH